MILSECILYFGTSNAEIDRYKKKSKFFQACGNESMTTHIEHGTTKKMLSVSILLSSKA